MSGFKSSDRSEWRVGAAARRDERSAKTTVRSSAPNTKNTRHWCKGKVGREHQLAVGTFEEVKGAKWGRDVQVQYCTACGREFATYYSNFDKEKPLWAR